MPVEYPYEKRERELPWWQKAMNEATGKAGVGVKFGQRRTPTKKAKRTKTKGKRVRNIYEASNIARREAKGYGPWYPKWNREPNVVTRRAVVGQPPRQGVAPAGVTRDPYAGQTGTQPQDPSRSWYPDWRYPNVPSGVARDPYTRTNIRPQAWDAMQYTPESMRLWKEYLAQQRAQEQYQNGYYGSGGYGYGGYGGYGRGGGGGYGGGSFPEQETKGYAPRDEYQVPWYQAMLQWNI